MKTIIAIVATLTIAACATTHGTSTAPQAADVTTFTSSTSAVHELGAEPTTVPLIATAPESEQPTNPEQGALVRIQNKLNVLASPKHLADVQAAKAQGADALQVACMDSLVDIGADLKAKPLIDIPSADLGPVDRSCGWCVMAQKRKLAAKLTGGPSLLTQLADGRKRLFTLARKGIVGCAGLTKDIELQAMTPENAAVVLLSLIELFGEWQ